MANFRGGPHFKAAAVQMTSTPEVAHNLRTAERLVRRAAAARASFVALPENFAFLRPERSRLRFKTTLDGELVGGMRRLARELEIHLLLGSIPEAVPGDRRVHNTSVLLSPDGTILAVYRKLHLFDVSIRGRVALKESRFVIAGDRVVAVNTRLGRLGLSICYDLRFPELYRRLALDGATVLCVPAAFTAYTGRFHWLPLLRARAIENQCWVVAPAQVGHHCEGRDSHGEAVIIDPWGEVVARRPRGEGLVLADIDHEKLERIRRGLPCLEHTHPALIPRRARPNR